jgi:Protein of unknown function (Gmx_para_CXXCG)
VLRRMRLSLSRNTPAWRTGRPRSLCTRPVDRQASPPTPTAVLARSALGDIDIVQLSRYKPPIYVSERFVDAFERMECTRLSFREVETT